MNKTLLSLLIICFLCSCEEYSLTDLNKTITYDIFPVIGQSNAYNGYGLDYSVDKTDPRIKQLGRFGDNNYKVIPAKDPLEHHIMAEGCNSLAMTFALNYLQYYWQGNREVLLIPGAKNGSSFRFKEWNKGDTLYNDIVRRVKYVLEKYPGSKVRAFLWHQGESDVYWGRDYAKLLDRTIINMRRDIAGAAGDSIPFLLGQFVPYEIDHYPAMKITDSVVRETPERLPFTAFVSSRDPFVIEKPDNTFNYNHFDAAGQRELGKRYFKVYQRFHP